MGAKLRILLGFTGSVAAVLYKKTISEFQRLYDVDVILTSASRHFINDMDGLTGVRIYQDDDEWKFDGETWVKGDRVLHIELRDQYSALVIVPCSANTLAKIANGICDNLLTSVARAWDSYKPMVIAPAMNTQMWEHPVTNKQLREFVGFSGNNIVVSPQCKMLACGVSGQGALANISTIVESVQLSLRWSCPLPYRLDFVIPVSPHPGAFAANRNGHIHTGVDLYAPQDCSVYAVEDGVVVGIEHFTGPQDNSPWWLDTDCVLVRGASGVVNYGEITPHMHLCPGRRIYRGDSIGSVKRVIPEGREHPEITGWKPSMLHMELYPYNATKASNGFDKDLLRDPTPFLIEGCHWVKTVTWEKS